MATISGQLDIVTAADSVRWQEALLGSSHDFYHEAAYHRFCSERGDGDGCLAVYREGESVLLWPYLLRPIEGAAGYCDVTSVYGYPGPLASDSSTGFVGRGLAALKEHWRSRNVVSAFTRLHPVLRNQLILESVQPAEISGITTAIDLNLPPEQIWNGYRKTLRYEIRRARRQGLTVERDSALGRLARFVDLYRETMNRNHAEASYFFDLGYFRRLFASFPERAHLLTVLDGETVVAGGVFIETGRVVQYHLSASNIEYARLSPTKLLLDEARLWAAKRGHKHLHLGGGRGARRDSLFAFKAAFGGPEYPFCIWKSILQPHLYQELCQLHQRRLGLAVAPANAGYFPAYGRTALTA